jgi:signal transduction histidine kinase
MQTPQVEQPRRSVRTKILWAVTPLVAVLGALLAFTTSEISRIHRDLSRVAEESREAEIARSLLTELRGAEAWALRAPEAFPDSRSNPAIEADLTEHLERSLALIAALLPAEQKADPSEPRHEARERDLNRHLRGSVEAARKHAGDPQQWSSMASDVAAARRLVEVIVSETRREALEASTHLDNSVHRLVDMLMLVALCGILTLIAVSWTFRRVVLNPLRRLQQATRELGRGSATASVPVRSDDEFGQLAMTFNEVSCELASYRAELEQKVADRGREVFRAARLADLGQLAAGIAHEINNPLGSIAAGIEGLRRELSEAPGTPARTIEFIDLVLREARRASEITSRLLRLGRHESARREPIWLAEETREMTRMVEHLARQRSIRVVVDFDSALPPITGDPVEWRQVLLNLVRNAVDASPDDGTVSLSGRRESNAIVLRVCDEGCGFAEEVRDKVFEPFFTTKPPGQGTGLGLAIVHRIVTEHGGSVRAQNWDRGGEIVVEMPLTSTPIAPTAAPRNDP